MRGIGGSISKAIASGKATVSKNIAAFGTSGLASEAKKTVEDAMGDVMGKAGELPNIDTSAVKSAIDSAMEKGTEAIKSKIGEAIGIDIGGSGENGQ